MEKSNQNEQARILHQENVGAQYDSLSLTSRFSEENLKGENREIVRAALTLEGFDLDTRICSLSIQGFKDGQSVKGSYFEVLDDDAQREKISNALLDVINVIDLEEKRKNAKVLARLFSTLFD